MVLAALGRGRVAAWLAAAVACLTASCSRGGGEGTGSQTSPAASASVAELAPAATPARAASEPSATSTGSRAASAASAAAPSGTTSAPGSQATGAARGDGGAAPPPGYVTMTVLEIAPTHQGDAVLLVDGEQEVVLPIFVGGTEGLSIRLRHEGRRFQRPLTHDLLDSVLAKLGGELVRVQVDELRGNTFVGSVFVRRDDRVLELDARPSDAIALALGSDVPIFVSRTVTEAAGIRKKHLDSKDREKVLRPVRPSDPISL